jgi:hypothetical protein
MCDQQMSVKTKATGYIPGQSAYPDERWYTVEFLSGGQWIDQNEQFDTLREARAFMKDLITAPGETAAIIKHKTSASIFSVSSGKWD